MLVVTPTQLLYIFFIWSSISCSCTLHETTQARQHVQCSIAVHCSSTPHENTYSVHTGYVFSRTLVFLTGLNICITLPLLLYSGGSVTEDLFISSTAYNN